LLNVQACYGYIYVKKLLKLYICSGYIYVNEMKNFWNSSLKKKLMKQGIDLATHKPFINNESLIKEEKENLGKIKELKFTLDKSKVSVSETSSLFWSNSVIWGWDLRSLRTTKPARLAYKNMRMSLRGHILSTVSVYQKNQCDCDYVCSE